MAEQQISEGSLAPRPTQAPLPPPRARVITTFEREYMGRWQQEQRQCEVARVQRLEIG